MDQIRERVLHAVQAAADKKATDIDVLHVEKLTSIADYFVICSATNERQTQAIAEAVEDRLREVDHARPILVEGKTPGRWILVDYGDFVVHIFTDECRRFYSLERLWGDAPNLTDQLLHGAESSAEGQS